MLSNVLILVVIFGIVHALPESLLRKNASNSKSVIGEKLEEDEDFSMHQLFSPYWLPLTFYNFYPQNNQNIIDDQSALNFFSNDLNRQLFLNQESVDLFPSIIQPSIMNIAPIQVNSPIVVVPLIKPFVIQKPTINSNGEVIIENLLGGIPFKCFGRPSGHYRDNYFCDVFHACVHGKQQKTYSCPFVGEAQYFDDNSRKCEFIRENPFGCNTIFFYN
ncbi:hypothetical protein BpHYR1_032626 [Brachionus plicatilis]|uniref:Chitin-binding type-2 domain-containing protein n=1 Tax=Brachionus plicatilis TaxID=10195 RepID=A0A3M7QWE8_BRAPC|nr:hypothetical protein BpHYR1_032626 [Brachionus plicatilis]